SGPGRATRPARLRRDRRRPRVTPMPDDRRAALVSVVVPMHNAAGTIGEQLDALGRQTFADPWELVVVDNLSDDPSAEVVRSYGHLFAQLRIVPAGTGRGPSYARNTGAAAAAGDLLCFCDADDVVDEGWLEALVAEARTHDFVAGYLDIDRLNDPDIRSWRPR